MSRLPNQPGELIDRNNVIRFTFDGKPVEAYEGDTIGSALFAAGRRTFSRSFKYHRRRGLLCCAGQCPNCIVAVDGAPGARACTEPVREGMKVEHLNAQPGLDLDVMRATDIVGTKFTPPGFYYKTFIRPRKLWPVYEKVLRHAAGLGVLRKEQADREWRTEYRRRHADVLVIGGGAAGRRAAAAAAEQGDDVVLVDEGPFPIEPIPGVEILARASALGFFDGIVPVWQGDTLHQIRARRHVFATGAIEQPLVFAGNDLPGVMLSGGAVRLTQLYAVRPGTRAVVVATSDRGLAAGATLQDAGVAIAAVADVRESLSAAARRLSERGIEVMPGHTILEARGGKAVGSAVLGPVGVSGASVEKTFDCDLVVVSGGFVPAMSLLLQTGAQTRYDPARGCFVVDKLPPGVTAVGDVAGVDEDGADGDMAAAAIPPPVSGAGRGKCFACLCEDVTAKDIELSVEEGYDSIELSKRYTTVTMGPCQGRMCQLPAIRLMAKETGQLLEEVGTTTARPPWVSVPMGVLAGRPFEPAKRSSIHGRHRELGGNIKWAGDWRRAYDYGDPQGEALAVHEAAGLIDVSTLGKLLVRGADAGEFLDRLYPNRFSDLKPGRIRYGVISSDAGRIVDDGTICRIDDETFYVTTTSSGAGAVEEWFSWWLADWRLRVQLTDLTQGLSAVNLAGPRARQILSTLTDLDCSPEAFKYLDGKHAKVAGVECLILRIGFVGEVGYEIHFAAAHGEHVWDALMEAGRDHGVRPFGLEPQRILRLQKMHILVGQDTDSESTPFGAAMPWIVKLDKEEDFIGKWALEHYAIEEPATRLVGFTLGNGYVPTEGSVILDGLGVPAGQVTSARFSPVLDRVIGMAWVPSPLARDGSQITISDEGRTTEAQIQTKPFYDPEGEVLRS
ncbi:MAG TPA: 2Fe-2S iron-sulfur cluster-binding protein [Solirubrobacteraceae bacterium]|jgi:sarcosine oxidase subunit alpha|nr:2Fe-2S iron-sulfur cluster-binding protein [Solirubrobacteraceae bacterium]